jgi:hypothetical protein
VKNVVRVSALLFFLWLPCLPESDTRSVAGVVTDKRGNALRGAEVLLENSVTLSIKSYITIEDGEDHFSEVYWNTDYTLKAKYWDQWSKRKTLSQFSSTERARVDLMIPIE